MPVSFGSLRGGGGPKEIWVFRLEERIRDERQMLN